MLGEITWRAIRRLKDGRQTSLGSLGWATPKRPSVGVYGHLWRSQSGPHYTPGTNNGCQALARFLKPGVVVPSEGREGLGSHPPPRPGQPQQLLNVSAEAERNPAFG